MLCSGRYPPETDKFENAGLLNRASKTVSPPGTEGSGGWTECFLEEEILRENFSITIGKVSYVAMNDEFVSADGDPDSDKAEPLCMLCGNDRILTRNLYAAGGLHLIQRCPDGMRRISHRSISLFLIRISDNLI